MTWLIICWFLIWGVFTRVNFCGDYANDMATCISSPHCKVGDSPGTCVEMCSGLDTRLYNYECDDDGDLCRVSPDGNECIYNFCGLVPDQEFCEYLPQCHWSTPSLSSPTLGMKRRRRGRSSSEGRAGRFDPTFPTGPFLPNDPFPTGPTGPTGTGIILTGPPGSPFPGVLGSSGGCQYISRLCYSYSDKTSCQNEKCFWSESDQKCELHPCSSFTTPWECAQHPSKHAICSWEYFEIKVNDWARRIGFCMDTSTINHPGLLTDKDVLGIWCNSFVEEDECLDADYGVCTWYWGQCRPVSMGGCFSSQEESSCWNSVFADPFIDLSFRTGMGNCRWTGDHCMSYDDFRDWMDSFNDYNSYQVVYEATEAIDDDFDRSGDDPSDWVDW